ncbi:MAG: universal stress protein [Polyangiaceae bacterium]|jgi:nucleotide-binding universal stress UspA family protein
MYARILVPTDGSACSELAIVHGVQIARAMRSTVTFIFVMDTLGARREGVVNIAEARELLTAQGETILARAEEVADAAGVRALGELIEDTPAEGIVSRSADFDLVVMGSHGKGILKRLTVGSVTEAVLHRVTCPVLVIRCPEPGQGKTRIR